jgi:hypothetical protein
MNEQIVKEGNRLIAEFLGVKPVDGWYNGWELHKAGVPFAYGAMGNGTHELKFHTSWDWLMPIVDKCSIMAHELYLEHDIEFWMFMANEIQAVWSKVVEFIKEHRLIYQSLNQ